MDLYGKVRCNTSIFLVFKKPYKEIVLRLFAFKTQFDRWILRALSDTRGSGSGASCCSFILPSALKHSDALKIIIIIIS